MAEISEFPKYGHVLCEAMIEINIL